MSDCSSERLSRRIVDQQEWINRHFRKLASLYRKSPCLWKKDMWSYLNSGQRHRAYTRIHLAMNLPGVTLVEIVLKIREMRRLYVNELRNLLEAKSNGYCYQVQIPWFYELHQFLYPYLDYDEAVELHKIDKSCGERRESEEFSPRCNCTRCISRKSSCVKSSTSVSPRGFSNSISSPGISLPKIKTDPRTCSHSCGRISNAKKQMERSVSCRIRSINSCCERLKRRENSSGDDETMNRRQENQEFRIAGMYSTASSSYTCESESDQWDIFSTTVTRFLKRLERPYALEAQAEIQRILKEMLMKSKIREKTYSRNPAPDRPHPPFMHNRERPLSIRLW